MKESSLRPGVGSAYGQGWSKLWKYFLELFLIFIIGWVIGAPASMGGWSGGVTQAVGIVGFLGLAYTILISGPLDYGISFVFLKAARDERMEIKDMFAAFSNYWNAVLANLLVAAIVVIGLALLTVPAGIIFVRELAFTPYTGVVIIGMTLLLAPGIFFGCKLAFTPYLVVDQKMEVIEALRESWRMTNGHAWSVFFIGLLAIPVMIAGLIVFGVGVIVSIMWINMAVASLYQAVSLTDTAPGQEAVR